MQSLCITIIVGCCSDKASKNTQLICGGGWVVLAVNQMSLPFLNLEQLIIEKLVRKIFFFFFFGPCHICLHEDKPRYTVASHQGVLKIF